MIESDRLSGSNCWLSIAMALPCDDHAAEITFWEQVCGWPLTAADFDRTQFVPAGGVAHFVLDASIDRPFDASLEIHTNDTRGLLHRAQRLGALVRSSDNGRSIIVSPGGFGFYVTERSVPGRVADATVWPEGHASRADQLTIDVGPQAWEGELAFWSGFTGWPVTQRSGTPFARLHTPEDLPVRVLLQRKDGGETSAHVDIATDNRDAETLRITQLGASIVRRNDRWTVLRTPAGSVFCVTDRSPQTGLPL